ncbi:MAG: hypothetical protein Q4E87_09005, partial [bacterium]|nr:hypothetical protein [bacterium]
MDVAIPASGLGVVPEASADNLTNYTKLAYTSQLSTEKQRITYSTNRAACNNPQPLTAYYRDQPIG